MSIGARIAFLRKKAGITQEQLATALGTTRQAVSKWESEKSLPDIDYAIGIGTYFGVSMDYLLLGKESPPMTEDAPIPCEKKHTPGKERMWYRILLLAALFANTVILILLPLFASMYTVHMRNIGPAYTDPNLYLQEWPLCGIKHLGWFGFWGSLVGLLWTFRKNNTLIKN